MSATAVTIIGSEIHPEIPMPHWATTRYLDDDGRIIADEASASLNGFDIELSQAHSPDDRERYEANVCVWWTNEWAAGTEDRETCTILPDRIPALIAALQHAQALLTPSEVTS